MSHLSHYCLCLLAATVTVACLLIPCVDAQKNCLHDGMPPKTVRSDLYRGQQSFTAAMLKAINKATPNENIFFSPYSTYHALLLAYFGAHNHTEQELVQALNLQWAENKGHVHGGYNLEKKSRISRSKKMPLQFASADKIYFDNQIKLTDCMLEILVDELESVSFRENAEECRVNINGWIANITQNEIPEMLSAGDVTSDTQMVLANAAYFKGQWASQFDPKDSKQEIFYTAKEKHSFTQMMHKRGTYNLAVDERLKAQILEMPYLTSNEDNKESDISMVIMLPSSFQLDEILEKLTPDTLDLALREGMAREVDVTLPVFEFEQNIELVPILRQMGINSIFDHGADFSDFSVTNNIMFGDAKHVAKIKVDEEGSTAAAATVLFSFRSARPIEPVSFECNRPFLFLIYDHSAKAILFAGIYRDPMTQK